MERAEAWREYHEVCEMETGILSQCLCLTGNLRKPLSAHWNEDGQDESDLYSHWHGLKVENYVFNVYEWGAMIQSTINSQCGQLQSAHGHAIKWKFQAQFSSAWFPWACTSRVLQYVTQYSLVVRLRDSWDQPWVCMCACVCERAHCTAGEVICSAALGFLINGQISCWNSIVLQTPVFPPTADEDT